MKKELKEVTSNRDDLQVEYTSQIDTLTTNVHTLQKQLSEVRTSFICFAIKYEVKEYIILSEIYIINVY